MEVFTKTKQDFFSLDLDNKKALFIIKNLLTTSGTPRATTETRTQNLGPQVIRS